MSAQSTGMGNPFPWRALFVLAVYGLACACAGYAIDHLHWVWH